MAREMKNSGVQWIGDIPNSWNIHPLGLFFSERVHLNSMNSESNLLSLSYGKIIKKNINTVGGLLPASYAGYNIIEADDIVIRPTDLQNDKKSLRTGLAKEHGIVTSAYIALKPSNSIYSPYFHYLLHSYDVAKVFYNMGNGVRQGLNYSELKKLLLIEPPLSEQKSIADFLDAKCGEIDGLLADLDAEVKTLTEYKKSLIAETVTRGLNPNATIKKVSLGWIDELPANWSVARIASVYSVRNEKVSDQDFQPLSVTMKGIVPQLENAAKTKHGDDRKLIRKGDFVINSRSDRRGSCGISPYDGSCSLINTVLAPREEMNPRYYNWLFHTTQFADEFYKWGYGIVDDLWTTNWGAMRRIQIPMPPLEEQAEIAAFLDKKVPQIDETITLKQDQIETLKAYKSSLIYEYVTGKKQVAI